MGSCSKDDDGKQEVMEADFAEDVSLFCLYQTRLQSKVVY